MIQKGDKVAVLDDELEGRVISRKGERITIETPEGFALDFNEKELVKIGEPFAAIPQNPADFTELLKEKESSKKKKSRRIKPKERNLPPMEVDLHIEKLVPSFKGMSNYDILTLQLDTAKRQVEFAMRKWIQKIVFIHGVGEGVLKAELDFLLGRYDDLKFYDADYSKYGLGATEVYFFQNN